MWPESNSGASELDIFEVLEQDPTAVYTTAHELLNGVATQNGVDSTVANTTTGFHTYAVDWEPTTLTFYMDGVVIATMPTPSTMDTPMFMTVNLAVGTAGTWAGAPTSSSEFPATMQVNYVRAYATPATMDVSGSAAINLGGVLVQLPSAMAGEQPVVSLVYAGGAVVGTTMASDTGACSFSSVAVGALLASYVTSSGQTMIAPVDVTAGQMATVSADDFVARRDYHRYGNEQHGPGRWGGGLARRSDRHRRRHGDHCLGRHFCVHNLAGRHLSDRIRTIDPEACCNPAARPAPALA